MDAESDATGDKVTVAIPVPWSFDPTPTQGFAVTLIRCQVKGKVRSVSRESRANSGGVAVLGSAFSLFLVKLVLGYNSLLADMIANSDSYGDRIWTDQADEPLDMPRKGDLD